MKKGLYKFLRVLAKILMKGFYRVEIIGKDNIVIRYDPVFISDKYTTILVRLQCFYAKY